MAESFYLTTGWPAAKSGIRPSVRILKRAALGLALAAGLTGASNVGYHYWTTGQYMESTDDAYVKADYTIIAPKVSGYISDVAVQDNEPVKAGQLLARIDENDFRTSLDQARAVVERARAAIRNLDAQIVLQQSVIEQAQSNVVAGVASLRFAKDEFVRYRDLSSTGFGTVQRAQQSESTLQEDAAQLQRARTGLVAAQRKIDVLTTSRSEAEAERDQALAAARQAELTLSYTRIVAPVDGIVGARSLRLGQYVQAGTQLMAVVPLRRAYIVANFKETQLTHVRAGQPVAIRIDSFPGLRIRGHVDSLSPASGLEFALLPPDNATGNFTKIVQRIPVRIVFDDASAAEKVRSGMSVEPTIDTRSASVASPRSF